MTRRPPVVRYLRVPLATCVVLGVVNTAIQVAQGAWITAMSVGSAWAIVLIGAYFSFQTGWYARGAEDAGGSVGHWMAWPVDEDGIPTTAPVTGRLVVDQVE